MVGRAQLKGNEHMGFLINILLKRNNSKNKTMVLLRDSKKKRVNLTIVV